MEANLGLNGRQGRSRFYGGGVGGLPPSAFEQLEECLFPKVISVSPCRVSCSISVSDTENMRQLMASYLLLR